MRNYIVVFFTLIFSFSLYAQDETSSPFGIRAYRYLNGLPSKNVSFGSRTASANRKGKPLMYIDLEYKQFLNIEGLDDLNYMHPGLGAKLHLPARFFSLNLAATYYLPFKHSIHQTFLPTQTPPAIESSNSLISIPMNVNYFFVLGKKLWYLNIGSEIFRHKRTYSGLPKEYKEFYTDNTFIYNYLKFGLGMHFHKTWYWEMNYLYSPKSMFDPVTDIQIDPTTGELVVTQSHQNRQGLTLTIGKRIFLKW
jgi:hypothetical protein